MFSYKISNKKYELPTGHLKTEPQPKPLYGLIIREVDCDRAEWGWRAREKIDFIFPTNPWSNPIKEISDKYGRLEIKQIRIVKKTVTSQSLHNVNLCKIEQTFWLANHDSDTLAYKNYIIR